MSTRRILIRQVKEWGEILTSIECRNRYELYDETDARIGYAAEDGGGFGRVMGRMFLGACRKATVRVLDPDGVELFRAEKPFRWYFHRMDVFQDGQKIGAIQRKFSVLHRKFVIENAAGEPVMDVYSPLFRIWTFKLMFAEQEIGRITKKWGGALREIFTDADTFGIEYQSAEHLEELRPILVAATFLVDFTCFENNNNSGGFFSSIGD